MAIQFRTVRKFCPTDKIFGLKGTLGVSKVASFPQCYSISNSGCQPFAIKVQPSRSFAGYLVQCRSCLSTITSSTSDSRSFSTKFSFPTTSTLDKVPAAYHPPTNGVISILPLSWIPYAELVRLNKPTGTYYLFFPCIFSTLMAASYTASPPLAVFSTSILFFAGAFIMRGAGCTINDLWDRDLDPYVERTRHRPIARGVVSPFNAIAFTGIQLLAGLGILLQFPTSCLIYGIPSLLLVTTYPLAKRITHYPQFVLGLTFSWGAIMGFPALGVDVLADSAAMTSVVTLYVSCVSWTVLYDMIYAHMDIKDDAKVGIKSIALRHEKETKGILSALALVQLGFLAAAGSAIDAGPMFYLGSCGSAAVTLGLMIWKVRLKEVSSCWWWFRNGALFTGGGIATGLLAEYLVKKYQPSIKSDKLAVEAGLS